MGDVPEGHTPLDLFCSADPLHESCRERRRTVAFGGDTLHVLSPEDLAVCAPGSHASWPRAIRAPRSSTRSSSPRAGDCPAERGALAQRRQKPGTKIMSSVKISSRPATMEKARTSFA